MTGSMYAGIAGMRSHMTKLSVIGNNVANVNTPGYKAGFTVFTESMYSTTQAGSNGTATAGGVNPIQIGYGCSIGSVDLDMSTKNYMPTNVPTHSMIVGDGFYMVGGKNPSDNPLDASDLLLSRVGNFSFREDGYLTDSGGNVVYGFLNVEKTTGAGTAADPLVKTLVPSTQLVPIRLPRKDTLTGAAHMPKIDWDGTAGTGNTIDAPANGTGTPPVVNTVSTERITATSISIGKNGEILCVNEGDGKAMVVGYVGLAKVANPAGVTHMGGAYYKAMEGAGKVNVSGINGVVTGYLNNVVRDAAGTGFVDATGAAFTGTPELVLAGSSTLQPGGLESSGTDVATEFSEMITTQRGYQANTRIITVTDSMLEELVNLKR